MQILMAESAFRNHGMMLADIGTSYISIHNVDLKPSAISKIQ